MFTDERPPPPPPTLRYSEIAGKAAQNIMAAVWIFRQYVEVIKVGFNLGFNAPDRLFIVTEIVLVVPTTAEKIVVEAKALIGRRFGFPNDRMTFDLTDSEIPETRYDAILNSLSADIVQQSKMLVKNRQEDFARQADQILKFQRAFAENSQ